MMATAGIEAENAGSASALFNMMRNLGGAVGIAILQTFLTKREQYHSNVLTPSVSLFEQATRTLIDQLTQHFINHGINRGAGDAAHRAFVAIGGVVQKQAFILAFSDTFYPQVQHLLVGLDGRAIPQRKTGQFRRRCRPPRCSAQRQPKENDHETLYELLSGRARHHQSGAPARSNPRCRRAGLEQSLIELVKTRVANQRLCVFASTCTPRTRASTAKPSAAFICWTDWRESPGYTERDSAALAWTEAVTLDLGKLHAPDDVYEAVRAQFSDVETVNSTADRNHQCVEQAGDQFSRGAADQGQR